MTTTLQRLGRAESDIARSILSTDSEASSTTTLVPEGTDCGRVSSDALNTTRSDFSNDLWNSWVYRRSDVIGTSTLSLPTRSSRTGHWSTLSALTTAEVSTASVVNLPVAESQHHTPRTCHEHPETPICAGCTPPTCSLCGGGLSESAIWGPEYVYCSECFTCNICKQPIGGLRYVCSSSGFSCLECDIRVNGRRRQEGCAPWRSLAHGRDKPLPLLPPESPDIE